MEQLRCYGCMQPRTEGKFCQHCGFAFDTPNAPHQLPVGTVLKGQYLVGKVLGQGGFGITYLARDYQTGTQVAIKEFFPDSMRPRRRSSPAPCPAKDRPGACSSA